MLKLTTTEMFERWDYYKQKYLLSGSSIERRAEIALLSMLGTDRHEEYAERYISHLVQLMYKKYIEKLDGKR